MRKPTSAERPKRVTALDGLRGWAALSVVTFHFLVESFGVLHPGFKNPVTAALLNGRYAVSLFFVISGVALSLPYFGGGGQSYLLHGAVKRYVRLVLPIIVFTAVVVVLGRLGVVWSDQAAVILERTEWGGLNRPTEPGILSAASFALRDVFFDGGGTREILPFLWTMPIELLGSMLLFLLLALATSMQAPWRTTVSMTVLLTLMSPYLGAFFIGGLIARLYTSGKRWSVMESHNGLMASVVVIVNLVVVSFMNTMNLPAFVMSLANVLLGSSLLYVVLCNQWLSNFFGRTTISRFLGSISFMIYIVHFIVLITMQSYLVVYFRDRLTVETCIFIAAAGVLVSVVLSWLVRPVDTYSHRLSGVFANYVLSSDRRNLRERKSQPVPVTEAGLD